MINFNSRKEKYSTMFGGKGTTTITLECDPNDTKEEVEAQLKKRYSFTEEYPGDTYVEDWYKDGNIITVTFRSWGCD